MILDLSYWAWIGSIFLILLSFQDIRNNMRVDSRHNFFMMGLTFSLLSHVDRNLFYIFGVALIIGLLLSFGRRFFSDIGTGDVQAFTWIFFGFSFLNPYFLLGFGGFLLVISGVYYGVKRFYGFGRVPYFPVIFLSFVFSCWCFGLF